MSLEARVAEPEENRVHRDQALTGIEGTVALILKEQVEQKQENNKRFNKIEELLIQILNNLADH